MRQFLATTARTISSDKSLSFTAESVRPTIIAQRRDLVMEYSRAIQTCPNPPSTSISTPVMYDASWEATCCDQPVSSGIQSRDRSVSRAVETK